MRRLAVSLLPVLALLALAGCGGDGPDQASDPGSSPSSSSSPASPSPSPSTPTGDGQGDPISHEVVTLVTETGAGGQVDTAAVPLTDAAAVTAYVGQFQNTALAADIQGVVDQTTVPDGEVLYAAVVSVGCTPPSDVVVTQGADGLLVTAQAVVATQQECFAAMTTVALVLAPDLVNGR